MNTKLLMTSSALVMALTGISLTLLPGEILSSLNLSTGILFSLILQILGALYFAFAMLNWTARANLIGGIYSRPVALANFTHFMVGGLALIKGATAAPDLAGIWIAATVYSIFAIFFGLVLFRHPVKQAVETG